jgi:pyruvate,orthophosphate dikinase
MLSFTVENKKLWMLQTRSGKRTAKSAVKIAVDMVKEKLISKKEAVLRIDPNSLDTLLHPTLDEKSSINVIAMVCRLHRVLLVEKSFLPLKRLKD